MAKFSQLTPLRFKGLNHVFTLVKWLAGKTLREMNYNVSNGTVDPTKSHRHKKQQFMKSMLLQNLFALFTVP